MAYNQPQPLANALGNGWLKAMNLDYLIRPSIIRNLNYSAWKKWACQQLLPWTQECLSSAQMPTCTAVYH